MSDIRKYRLAYNAQRNNAKRRGIEFKLTFDQWLAWWGNDIDRRGSGKDNLQMQRYGDLGGYELGNIKKGHPKENSKTAGIGRKNKACFAAAVNREKRTDDLMDEEAGEKHHYDMDEDERELSKMFGIKSSNRTFYP